MYFFLLLFLMFSVTTHAVELPLDITADELSADLGDQNAVFKGNVVAKRGDLTLKSNLLRVQQGANDSIEHIIASGNIRVTRKNDTTDETATGDEAIYTPTDQLLVLKGNVKLMQGNDTIAGERLVYDLGRGTAKLDAAKTEGGRVKATIGPKN